MAVFSTTDAVMLLDADAAGHSTADAAAGGGRRPGSSSSGTRSGRLRGRLLRLLLRRRISRRTRPAELGREAGDLAVPIPPDSPARRFEVADDARPAGRRRAGIPGARGVRDRDRAVHPVDPVPTPVLRQFAGPGGVRDDPPRLTCIDRRLGRAALCGSLAGMSGGRLTPDLSAAVALARLTSIAYELSINTGNACHGVGGRLGAAAFLATSALAKYQGVRCVGRKLQHGLWRSGAGPSSILALMILYHMLGVVATILL